MGASFISGAALVIVLFCCLFTQQATAFTIYSYATNCSTSTDYLTYQSFENDKCVQVGNAQVYMFASCNEDTGAITLKTCFASPNCDGQCTTSTKQDGQCDGNSRWSCKTKQPKAEEVVFSLYNASSSCSGTKYMWGAFNTKCISNSSSFSAQYLCEAGQPSTKFCFSSTCNGTCYTRPIDKCLSGTIGYTCGSDAAVESTENGEDNAHDDGEDDSEALSDQFLNNLASMIQSRMQQFKEMRLEEEEFDSAVEQFMKTVGSKIRERFAKFRTNQSEQVATAADEEEESEADQFLTALHVLINKRLEMYKHMKLSDELEQLLSDEVFLKTLRNIYRR